ncbi:substrate-binding domain-containing protein, partial [Escherichia coli]
TATKLLIRQGHRRIACVTTDLPIDDRAQRLAGYRQAMAAGGIEVPGSWIISVPFNERGGELAAERVLASDQRFTAAVTFNDVMAAGMMRTCHQRQV